MSYPSSRSRILVLVAALGVVMAGCEPAPVTQVLLVVDTDLDVPATIDELGITVTGPSGEVHRASGPLASPSDLPGTLGIVHRGGPLGEVYVEIAGRRGGEVVIERKASFDWVADETRVLRVNLASRCLSEDCGDDRTCDVQGCRSVRATPAELSPYEGQPQRSDAGAEGHVDASPLLDAAATDASAPDGGPLVGDAGHGAPEDGGRDAGLACEPGFADCNGQASDGCETDLESDESNCGRCGNDCAAGFQVSSGTCEEGTCAVEACEGTWADCDGLSENGCEVQTEDDRDHCGGCSVTCVPGHECCRSACRPRPRCR
jgi:hypothetical protein